MTGEKIECACGKQVRVEISGQLRKHGDGEGVPCDGGLSIGLPWPAPPVLQNDRLHWAAKHRAMTDAKTAARWAIRAARPRKLPAAEVTLHYRVPDLKIRDTDGPAPTLKAVIDALVAERILPADDWLHVPFSGIRFHPPRPRLPSALWVTLKPVAPGTGATP